MGRKSIGGAGACAGRQAEGRSRTWCASRAAAVRLPRLVKVLQTERSCGEKEQVNEYKKNVKDRFLNSFGLFFSDFCQKCHLFVLYWNRGNLANVVYPFPKRIRADPTVES